jgi:hypothetical protein
MSNTLITNSDNRDKWIITNVYSKPLSIGDLPNVPTINPGQSFDILNYASREKISQSKAFAYMTIKGWLSLTKTQFGVETSIPSSEAAEAVMPTEENEVYAKSEVDQAIASRTKYGLATNLVNIGDTLTQNVWHEIPVTNLIANSTDISSLGNYILLASGVYQLALITVVQNSGLLAGTIFNDIFDVDLSKEVDYSLNLNSARITGSFTNSILTNTIIIVSTATKRIIPRVMSDLTTTALGAYSVPSDSLNFCMRTVIQKL